MTGNSELIELARKIVQGRIHKPEVEKELDRIAALYGEDCFESYDAMARKPQAAWDEAYLKELDLLGVSGASSRNYYLHLAEVSDEVYSKKRQKKAAAVVKAVVAVLLVAVVIAAVIAVVADRSA